MSDFKTRLVEEQVPLLKVQANAMSTYNQCLKERLERL